MCVNATVENDIVTYEITSLKNSPENVGWFALGFGENMIGSHMVIMWQNEDGSMTLSQRYARYFVQPVAVADPPRIATSVVPKLTSWQHANATTFAFQIPAHQSLLNGTRSREALIWALSPIKPAKDYLSHLARHFEIGHLVLDFSGTSDSHSSEKWTNWHPGHERTVHAHAFFLTVGFLVLMPFGILAGRWGRTVSPVWIKVHSTVNMMLAGPMIIFGWLLGPIAVYQHGVPHFNDEHKLYGLLLLFFYVAQVLLGRYIHKRRHESPVPITKPHPPLNLFHIGFGLLIMLFAFLQICGGIDKLELGPGEKPFIRWTKAHIAWAVWAGVFPLIYLAGLFLLPKQLRQERQSLALNNSNYLPLSEQEITAGPTASTRLLFDNPDLDDDLEDAKRVDGKSRLR